MLEVILEQRNRDFGRDYNYELCGSLNENTLLKSSPIAIFNQLLSQIDMDNMGKTMDPILKFRLYWLKASYEELFGTTIEAVKALKACCEILKNHDEPFIRIPFKLVKFNSVSSPLVSAETIDLRIQVQGLRLKIAETNALFLENNYTEVYKRLVPLLENEGLNNGIGNIFNQMPGINQLDIMELLKSVNRNLLVIAKFKRA